MCLSLLVQHQAPFRLARPHSALVTVLYLKKILLLRRGVFLVHINSSFSVILTASKDFIIFLKNYSSSFPVCPYVSAAGVPRSEMCFFR